MGENGYTSIRVTAEAHAVLRQIYADTGETITEIATRLILAGAKKKLDPKPRRR